MDWTEQAIAALSGTGLRRESRFPALAATLDEVATEGGQDNALDFGLTRSLDGVELLIAHRATPRHRDRS